MGVKMEESRDARPAIRDLLKQQEHQVVAVLLNDVLRRSEFRMRPEAIAQIRKGREALEGMANQRFADYESFRLFGLHLAYQIGQNLDSGIYADSIVVRVRYLPSAPHRALSRMSFSTYFMRSGDETAPALETFDLNFAFTPELLSDVHKPVRRIADSVVFGTNAAMREFFYWHCRDLNRGEDINREQRYSYIYLPLELSSELRRPNRGSSLQA